MACHTIDCLVDCLYWTTGAEEVHITIGYHRVSTFIYGKDLAHSRV